MRGDYVSGYLIYGIDKNNNKLVYFYPYETYIDIGNEISITGIHMRDKEGKYISCGGNIYLLKTFKVIGFERIVEYSMTKLIEDFQDKVMCVIDSYDYRNKVLPTFYDLLDIKVEPIFYDKLTNRIKNFGYYIDKTWVASDETIEEYLNSLTRLDENHFTDKHGGTIYIDSYNKGVIYIASFKDCFKLDNGEERVNAASILTESITTLTPFSSEITYKGEKTNIPNVARVEIHRCQDYLYIYKNDLKDYENWDTLTFKFYIDSNDMYKMVLHSNDAKFVNSYHGSSSRLLTYYGGIEIYKIKPWIKPDKDYIYNSFTAIPQDGLSNAVNEVTSDFIKQQNKILEGGITLPGEDITITKIFDIQLYDAYGIMRDLAFVEGSFQAINNIDSNYSTQGWCTTQVTCAVDRRFSFEIEPSTLFLAGARWQKLVVYVETNKNRDYTLIFKPQAGNDKLGITMSLGANTKIEGYWSTMTYKEINNYNDIFGGILYSSNHTVYMKDIESLAIDEENNIFTLNLRGQHEYISPYDYNYDIKLSAFNKIKGNYTIQITLDKDYDDIKSEITPVGSRIIGRFKEIKINNDNELWHISKEDADLINNACTPLYTLEECGKALKECKKALEEREKTLKELCVPGYKMTNEEFAKMQWQEEAQATQRAKECEEALLKQIDKNIGVNYNETLTTSFEKEYKKDELYEVVKEAINTSLGKLTYDNNGNKIKEEKSMFENIFGKYEIGEVNDGRIAFTPFGMAFKDSAGDFVVYKDSEGTNVGKDMIMEMPLYKMPVSPTSVKPNDIIVHYGVGNSAYLLVKEITDKYIVVIDPQDKTIKTLVPEKSIFGFNFIIKVFSPIEPSALNASADNPFGNILPLMFMSKGKDNDMFKYMMLMQMCGQKEFNPMMFMMMGKDNDDFFKLMMMSQMGNMNMFNIPKVDDK